MKLVKDKSFYRMVVAITVPVACQNLITFLTNMMDTVMLGRADSTGTLLSASSLANQPFFILQLFIFGLAGGGSVLTSQYWGKKDLASVKIIISMILKLAVVISAIFALAVLTIPRQVMSLYTESAGIIDAGAEYLSIMGFAYIFFGLSFSFICSLRSVEIVKISVVASIISLVVNVSLNYCLIFGNFGFPQLGIKGAAIATLIARIIEFLVAIIYVFCFDKRLGFRLRDLVSFNGTLFADLMRHGSPVLANELMWGIGISVQAAILGHIAYCSGDPVAANSIAGTVQQLCNIVGFGIANAASVIIGKSVGEGKIEQTRERAHTLAVLALGIGVVAFVMVFVLRKPIAAFYNVAEDTRILAEQMLVVVAFVTFCATLSGIYIVGILRGAGDTKFCLFTELATLWGIAIPLAAFLAFGLQIPVPLVLIGMKSDEMVKIFVCLFRIKSGKWIRCVTRDFPDNTKTEILTDREG